MIISNIIALPGSRLWREVIVCGDCMLLNWGKDVYLCSRHCAMATGKPYARSLTKEELMR